MMPSVQGRHFKVLRLTPGQVVMMHLLECGFEMSRETRGVEQARLRSPGVKPMTQLCQAIWRTKQLAGPLFVLR
jgi:hypothetical protein